MLGANFSFNLIDEVLFSFAEIDYCHSDPCLNNGTCQNRVDGRECNCHAKFSGKNCEQGNLSGLLIIFLWCLIYICLGLPLPITKL